MIAVLVFAGRQFASALAMISELFSATMIVAGLSDPRMRIEIEVTARRATIAGSV